MQKILENLMQRCLCWKVLTGWLPFLFFFFFFSIMLLVFLLQQDFFKKSKVTKTPLNIPWGHQWGEKHFCISNVIFIRFNLKATNYYRCIAGSISRDSPWRSVVQIKNILFWLKNYMQLLSNLYQQLYHKMNKAAEDCI